MKILQECKNAGLQAPSFSHDPTGFRIEFLKSTVKSSEKSSEKLLELIKSNPKITIAVLAQELELTSRMVEKQLAKLKSSNQIKRIGPDKGGHWEVVE